MTKVPEYYFRVRENGAVVFRVETENRMRRIEMQQIAIVNVRNGEIKAHGTQTLSEQDRARIESWLAERRDTLRRREMDDIDRTIDRLNLTAAWAQQTATPDDLDAVSDRLLMAMHDLRSVLVRKKSQNKGDTD